MRKKIFALFVLLGVLLFENITVKADGYTVDDLIELEEKIPMFYDVYCTTGSAIRLTNIKEQVDEAIASNEESVSLLDNLHNELSEAIADLRYNSDSVVPQVYVTTDDGRGGVWAPL